MTFNKWQQWEGRVVGGRYELQQHLGGSDHGAVYLTGFGEARAVVKLVPEDAPDAAAQLARWEAACNLSHANLLRVHDTGRWHADDERDMFFALMEFADDNLGDVLAARPLTPIEARDMLEPTLAALEYLHGRNLVHGCLKPSNVMAIGSQLKLAVDGVRRSGTRLTSVEQEDWRAVPEVFNAGVSSRNDVWALGLLLVESLTRQKPKLERASEGAIQVPDDIVEPFKSIAQACLQRDPAKRCSIAEVRHMLQRPMEPAKAPAQVVSIRTEAQPGLKPAKEETVSQPAPEPARDLESKQAADLEFLLDESELPQRRNWKPAPLSVAVFLAILAILAVVTFAGRHTSETRLKPPAAITAPESATVQPHSNPSASLPLKSAAGSVTKQVMPEVSRVAQNSIRGVVKVRVQVNVNDAGQVMLAGLAAQGPSRYFARQALEAVRRWTFTAPVVDGKPMASRWMIEFDFRRSGAKAEARVIAPKV